MQHNAGFVKLVDEVKPTVEEIDIATLKKMQAARENFQLIDVREDHEWQQGHIPGAVHLSKGVIERDIESQIPNRETKLVLYCGGGSRSALAAANLQKMGYRRVLSLKGGFRGWLQQMD